MEIYDIDTELLQSVFSSAVAKDIERQMLSLPDILPGIIERVIRAEAERLVVEVFRDQLEAEINEEVAARSSDLINNLLDNGFGLTLPKE